MSKFQIFCCILLFSCAARRSTSNPDLPAKQQIPTHPETGLPIAEYERLSEKGAYDGSCRDGVVFVTRSRESVVRHATCMPSR